MSNPKPCFLAGVCCVLYTVASAQAEWPTRTPIKDTSITAYLPSDQPENVLPSIYYQNKPSTLVYIDGTPSIIVDEDLKMYRIVNTEHLIIKNHHDNRFYLYGGSHWYVADSATGGYGFLKTYPEVITLIDSLLKMNARQALRAKGIKPKPGAKAPTAQRLQVIVTSEPAELLQTRGLPQYKTIPGSSLQYVYNSNNDLFRDSLTGQFYVLLSGRWYRSSSLSENWTYTAADKLPSDFSKIPGGMEKSHVLYHVPGTDSSRKALGQAQMIYTTLVKRDAILEKVEYDGGAEFSSISNTGLFSSENSNIPVINAKDKYYALKEGVWFVSNDAIGSVWRPSTERPPEIDKIPVTHRMYYTKFVYIYDTTETYVHTGYTVGYLNSYIADSNNVVYGTGLPYKSWYRRTYYPANATWGFGWKYNGDKGWIRKHELPFYKWYK